jgi:hypothetical protein
MMGHILCDLAEQSLHFDGLAQLGVMKPEGTRVGARIS